MKAGKVKLENRYDFLNLNQFDLQWQLLKDGQIVESGVLSLGDAAPNKDIEVTIPYKTALDAGSEYFLNLSARLKKDCNWANAGHEVASEQYSLTGKIAVAPVDTAFNDTLKVEEEKGQIGFRAPGFFIAFNPETGKMVSLRYAGTDMIYNKEGFDFNWFRAMDNDKRDYLPTTVKKQAFDWKQATDKKSVTITTSLEATVGSGTQKSGTAIRRHLYSLCKRYGRCRRDFQSWQRLQPASPRPPGCFEPDTRTGGMVRTRPD